MKRWCETSMVPWVGLCIVALTPLAADAQWTALTTTNATPNYLSTCLVLTDGDALCHQYNTNQWWRLTPDAFGSYGNGTWSTIATMPNATDTSTAGGGCAPCVYAPLYYYSGVLPDGQVVVVGGEYNTNGQTWTDTGFIYNPVTDTWSARLTGLWGAGAVGDAQGIIIDNGTFLLARSINIADPTGVGFPGGSDIGSLNVATGAFTALNPTGKADSNNEENWNILPNGTVLTVDSRIASQFEIYNPATNAWTSGATPVNLADTGNSAEVGPGVLRPDGTLVYFSGNPAGQNAVYNTVTGTWSNTASMDFPAAPTAGFNYSVPDGPAALLPNGNVLVMASPMSAASTFNAGSTFYEFNLSNNLNAVTNSPNAASFVAYQGRMVVLPSGDVLLTAYSQPGGAFNNISDVQLYNNGGAPQNAWRPVITSSPTSIVAGGTNYLISGRLFNGFSEGASYGDDAAMSTNFPIVRITNQATGHVFYARTHDHTSMGVELVTSAVVTSTSFDVPASLEPGASTLEVVVNGIASLPVSVNAQDLQTTKTHNPSRFTQGDSGDTFFIDVDNIGVTPTVGLVTVTDSLPASLTATAISGTGWSCNLGTLTCTRNDTLSAGGSYPAIVLTVDVADDAPLLVTNNATVSGGGEAPSATGNNTGSDSVYVVQHTTTTVEPATGHYHDPVTLTATVTPAGVTGSVEFFVDGSSVGFGTYVSATGVATKSYVIQPVPGSYDIGAAFESSNDLYLDSDATLADGLTVTHEETTLTYDGPTVIANTTGTATVSATLVEDGDDDDDADGGVGPIAGATIHFTLGAEVCDGVTNASGTASCVINLGTELGPRTVTASFAQNDRYQASSDSADVIVFAFLAEGSFAVGDLSSVSGTTATFWRDDWSTVNSLSGGTGPDKFKGFINELSVSPPACGAPWASRQGGNSVMPPPAGALPSYMGVVVASSVVKTGPSSMGDTARIVVVQTDPGYDPNPGHYGTGTIVAEYCPNNGF